MALHRVGDAGRRELEERGLDILWTVFAAAQLMPQPRKIEEFAARALGGRQSQVGLIEQFPEEHGIAGAGRAPDTVSVVVEAAVFRDPGVQQPVAGPGVEACDRSTPGQDRDIADAAEIDDGTVFAVTAKHQIMKHGQQRRPLTTGGDVTPAKICHHCDSGALGQCARIPDLGRERKR